MCQTEPVASDFASGTYHCKGKALLCVAVGNHMRWAIGLADAQTLSDALKHRPGKTQRKLIQSRLNRLQREESKSKADERGYEWCGVGRR